jgi:hypothetical protein
MPDKIDINSAPTSLLTQLPGIGKNIAYNIVNHRTRHGFFTVWEELAEVKDFPIDKLDEIRGRAELIQPPEERPNETVPPPRHLETHMAKGHKGSQAYTKAMRSTRRPERLHTAHDHTHHDSSGKKSA